MDLLVRGVFPLPLSNAQRRARVNLGLSLIIHEELSLLDVKRICNTKRREGGVRCCSASEKRPLLT